ncbi:HD-GYP domain-containing protein [Desulfospira joergensenii]|uniref:HD-GYP domain-containing protein n=1 Tax=Desulfospira joergensenii TaxID=53329 RepID=UPI0003B33B4F|nr:HD domain-containing protein [Desulfospira joergensenii]
MTNLRKFSIDQLIKIVEQGGVVKTGIDVYNSKGMLLLDKDILVRKAKTLNIIKENGIKHVMVDTSQNGGFWNENGDQIIVKPEKIAIFFDEESGEKGTTPYPDTVTNDVEMRLIEIEEMKAQAQEKYDNAKGCIKKVLGDIEKTGGEFDFNAVESHVSEMVSFLESEENPFSYLTQEIFSYDDYLYNHSINVCTIGTAMLNRFNSHFSKHVDHLIKGNSPDIHDPFETNGRTKDQSYFCYYKEDIQDISLGFFLHDIGKVLVADAVLNKEGKLSDREYAEVQRHSFEYGVELLEKNRIKNSFVRNIVEYHHAPLLKDEERCYPRGREFNKVPVYTKICKLADIYDAMTSKRCYKEAVNPINVVTRLFRTYAKKDSMLQFILHSFVKSIGIYPPGSIVYLRNGQLAYVLESRGPIVIPFTDAHELTLNSKQDPVDINAPDIKDSQLIDNRRSVKSPKDVFNLLPPYLRKIAA